MGGKHEKVTAEHPGHLGEVVGRIITAVLTTALIFVSCGGDGATGGGDAITVGAVTFAENQIVAEMYAQVLEREGLEVDRRFNFSDRESMLPEIESGAVDVVPEYLATLLTALDTGSEPGSDAGENLSALESPLEEIGATALEPSSANDTNAIVVAGQTAEKYDLESVSDLAPHASKLVFGGPPECPERQFCLQGLEEVYGLEFKEFKALDAGGSLTVAALTSGEIDVALLFSTSGVIAERGWVLLEDDRGLQAADNITPVIRHDAHSDEIEAALNEVSAALTTEKMTELNAMVEVEGKDFRDVATDFLRDEGLID